MSITWILERDVFEDQHQRLAGAAIRAGHDVLSWNDDWLETQAWPVCNTEHVVFHGSLGNANVMAGLEQYQPGAYCKTKAFRCSQWYDALEPWRVHPKWVLTTVGELVDCPEEPLSTIGAADSFFVRPDSPLKPFSGRVIQRADLTLEALDYGFYYDDRDLPILVTPVVEIGYEWRIERSE